MCSRAVTLPAASAASITATTSSSVIRALSWISQPGLAYASSAGFTSEPA